MGLEGVVATELVGHFKSLLNSRPLDGCGFIRL